MGFLQITPPQGFSNGKDLSIITGPASPRFTPPKGISGAVPPQPVGGNMLYEDGKIMEYENNVTMEYQ